MSTAKLVRWGNSIGIRIPAQDLQSIDAYVGEKFEIFTNEEGGFTMIPIKNPQEGWLEAFNAAADADHDQLLIQNIENDFDKDEWQW